MFAKKKNHMMFAKHSLGGTILSFGLFNPKNTSFLKIVKNHNSTTVNSVDMNMWQDIKHDL